MYGKMFFALCAVALAIADSAPPYSENIAENEIQNSSPQQPEQENGVQIKDPAYIPAYGYESHNGYEGYVPTDAAGAIGPVVPGPSSFLTSLLTVPTFIFSVLGKAAHLALASAAAVVVGVFITFAFCTFTPFCSVSLGQYERIQEEVRSFVTPQRLASASDFVKNAIEKYQKMQFGAASKPGSCTCLVFSDTYGKERGVFSSPDYPRPYARGIDCLLYTFAAKPHEIVEITFTDFDVYKKHLECLSGDYLKVYQASDSRGIDERAAWSRVLCGGRSDAPPAPLYSAGSTLVLEFHSQSEPAPNSTGFVGTFRFIDKRQFQTDGQRVSGTTCDHKFMSGARATHGRLYSPRYPAAYPNNIRCSYYFRARSKERVRVLFEEVSLQIGDISCLNRADIIKVFDGRSEASPAITVLCNELAEYEVLSTGPDLFIEFTANSEWPGQGFKASFQFQPVEDTNSESDSVQRGILQKPYLVIGPEVSATTSSCDQIFSSDTTKNGTLLSPQYPNPYPPKSYCHYDFQGRGRERVQLIFRDFNLYRDSDEAKDCESIDAVQAYVHIDGRLEKIESFCSNNLPKAIMSNGPKLTLEFRGIYSSHMATGFKISYAFLDNFGVTGGRQLLEFPCGFVYNSSEVRNGTLTSPNFPGPYPRDTECHYFFNGGPKEKVHLHFLYFDVEGVLPCEAISASDYVEFSNYVPRDRKYNRYCGQLKEFHVESESKFFRVTFKSNDRLDGTGFKAYYQFLNEIETYTPIPDLLNSSYVQGAALSLLVLLTFILLTNPHVTL